MEEKKKAIYFCFPIYVFYNITFTSIAYSWYFLHGNVVRTRSDCGNLFLALFERSGLELFFWF